MSGKRRIHPLPIAVMLATASPACSVYGKCGFAGCPGDAKITADVLRRFAQYPASQPPNLVRVQTLDHVVYLSGQVDTDAERLRLESAAHEAAGDAPVVNMINLGYQGR